jgi:hypothetical protein
MSVSRWLQQTLADLPDNNTTLVSNLMHDEFRALAPPG